MTKEQEIQFKLLKEGKLNPLKIDDWTDEMRWWIVENSNILPKNIEFSDEMIITLVRQGKHYTIPGIENVIISEDDWIEGINNIGNGFFDFFHFYKLIKDNSAITKKIALILCLKNPNVYTDLNHLILEDDKEKISEVFFSGIASNKNWHFDLPNDLPISDEQWKMMLDTKYLISCTGRITSYIQERNDVPDFVKKELFKYDYVLKECGKISSKDLILWIEVNKKSLDSGRIISDLKYIECDDMENVLSKHGWFIKYCKNQTAKLCNAAIKCDPSNIKYIKKPSDKLKILALSLDKTTIKYIEKTKSVCDYLGIEFKAKKNKYPDKQYLVKLSGNLCDEDDLTKILIVKGKDMPKFMEKTVSLSFGNLYDENQHFISDIATLKPITDEELKVIKKFGLDNLESGYFNIE